MQALFQPSELTLVRDVSHAFGWHTRINWYPNSVFLSLVKPQFSMWRKLRIRPLLVAGKIKGSGMGVTLVLSTSKPQSFAIRFELANVKKRR